MHCNGCGWLIAGDPVSDWLGNFCNADCQALRHRRNKKKEPVEKVCSVCSTKFFSSRDSQHLCSKDCGVIANRLRSRETWLREKASQPETKSWLCKWCNEDIVVPWSYTGNRVYHDKCRAQANRHKNRVKSVRRQNARVEPGRIDVFDIAARDGYICHICNETVDMTVPRTSRFGATLDHVYPLSLGGADSASNVKLAHWICNVKKSNKLESNDG